MQSLVPKRCVNILEDKVSNSNSDGHDDMGQ